LLDGYRYGFLPNVGGDRGVRGFFSLVNLSVVAELWRGKFDAILIHGHNFATNLLAMCIAKIAGTRVFMRGDTHLLLRRHPLKRIARGPLMKILYRLCDACLYIGSQNRDFYRTHGVPFRKLFFVPFTVDNEAFAKRANATSAECELRRRALGLPPDTPVILFASKLVSQKRPLDLLHAAVELGRRGVRAALLFVGDGEERAALEREVTSLGLAHVVFTGFVNQSELAAHYAISDVLVLPSGNETWGLVINEVMSCGVPVVTTREVGASLDLVRDGETGFTYETGDIAALADALARIITDGQLRRTMRENCVRRMATWSYAESVQGIRDALQAKPPRRR
jgi:glycosyltransferase involved in cell wall biosynthesis